MTKLTMILDEIMGRHQPATIDDIRKTFGEYHNLLHWLSAFLVQQEKVSDDYIVDACNIADTQGPEFHEWLIHWAAHATINSIYDKQQERIAKLAPKYETGEAPPGRYSPLSPEYVSVLIRNSEPIRARLDLLCRFVLVLHGMGQISYGEIATQFRISDLAVERAYAAAFETVELASEGRLGRSDISVRLR